MKKNFHYIKSHAFIFSVLLCVILYLSFLTLAFTEKTSRDSYICYTTKTGTHFHSATCKYLNTAYETTVYEVCKDYKPCDYCNPCTEAFKTKITMTERNYLAPALISIPLSVAIYFVLIKTNKGDD